VAFPFFQRPAATPYDSELAAQPWFARSGDQLFARTGLGEHEPQTIAAMLMVLCTARRRFYRTRALVQVSRDRDFKSGETWSFERDALLALLGDDEPDSLDPIREGHNYSVFEAAVALEVPLHVVQRAIMTLDHPGALVPVNNEPLMLFDGGVLLAWAECDFPATMREVPEYD